MDFLYRKFHYLKEIRKSEDPLQNLNPFKLLKLLFSLATE